MNTYKNYYYEKIDVSSGGNSCFPILPKVTLSNFINVSIVMAGSKLVPSNIIVDCENRNIDSYDSEFTTIDFNSDTFCFVEGINYALSWFATYDSHHVCKIIANKIYKTIYGGPSSDYNIYAHKIKLDVSEMRSQSIALDSSSSYSGVNEVLIWISNKCNTIHVTNSYGFVYPKYSYKNYKVYCEASSKPAGWETNWNKNIDSVTWGVTEQQFDAL